MVSINKKHIIKDIESALKQYPLLKLSHTNNKVIVKGEIQLIHIDYGEVDKYSVFISFPANYPQRFPIVIETSLKIPRTPERHINASDHSLCLAVLPEELKIAKNGLTFKYFLDKVLVPHLARETYYNIEKIYPDGEYEHGKDGVWKYFEEIFKTTNRQLIISEIHRIMNEKMLNRNDKCICGSGLKFKKCHLKQWNDVLYIGMDNLNLIVKYLKEEYE